MFGRRRTLGATAVAAIALALAAAAVGAPVAGASSCASATASPGRAGAATTVRATACLINAVRRDHGLHALRLSARLSSAARGHSVDMVRRRYFAHATPEGLSPTLRVRRTGYLRAHRRWIVGETLAWWRGRAAPAQIVRAWMHSPPHREVLLTPAFRDVGIGIALGVPRPVGRGGGTYTADFGVRR
jgi:uncharacterized protein YkwD